MTTFDRHYRVPHATRVAIGVTYLVLVAALTLVVAERASVVFLAICCASAAPAGWGRGGLARRAQRGRRGRFDRGSPRRRAERDESLRWRRPCRLLSGRRRARRRASDGSASLTDGSDGEPVRRHRRSCGRYESAGRSADAGPGGTSSACGSAGMGGERREGRPPGAHPDVLAILVDCSPSRGRPRVGCVRGRCALAHGRAAGCKPRKLGIVEPDARRHGHRAARG
ncbi:MAG: hypothetical protein V7607_2526 [Solirubrobacteraceae bacterium]